MALSDPQAIKALGHPLRLDLLELLAALGPATAAQCGRALGIPQANCSFHLRQLAKYGFVEDAGPGTDKRARLWRLVVRGESYGVAKDVDPVVAREFERVVVEREAQTVLDYIARQTAEPDEWRAGSGGMATTIALSAAEAAELKKQWKELLAPFVARTEANGYQRRPGQRYFRHFMAATPLPDINLGDTDHDDPA